MVMKNRSFAGFLAKAKRINHTKILGKQLNLPTDKAAQRSILNTVDLSRITVLPPGKTHEPRQQLGGRSFWHGKRTSQA